MEQGYLMRLYLQLLIWGFNPADVEYISDMPYSYKEWDNDTRQMIDRKKDVPQYSKLLAFLKTHKIGFVVVMRTKLKSMAVNGYDLSMYDSINDAFNDVESVWIPDAENEKENSSMKFTQYIIQKQVLILMKRTMVLMRKKDYSKTNRLRIGQQNQTMNYLKNQWQLHQTIS